MTTIVPLLLLCAVGQAQPGRITLADFEAGIEGWWTNPWGGGEIVAQATGEARFGRGALRCDYRLQDGKLKGNLISPWLPPDAPWRQQRWGALSLWYRTEGTTTSFSLSLAKATAEGQPELTFTRQLPATDAWRNLIVDPRTLWNRERMSLDLRELGRLIVGAGRPGTVWIDQLCLVPLAREVPLEPYTETWSLGELAPGRYQWQGPVAPWRVSLTIGGRTATASAPADDEPVVDLNLPVTAEGAGEVTVVNGNDRQRFTFPVLLPAEEPEIAPLGILPTPKRVTPGQGAFALAAGVRGEAHGSAAPFCAALLQRRLKRDLGLEVTIATRAGDRQWLRLGQAESPELPGDLPAEGYRLVVSPRGAAVAARDERGLFNGALSLLQMIAAASLPARPLAAPAADVTDWPDLPVRSVSIPIPTDRWGYPNDVPVPPEFLIDFLDRMVVARKYNQVIFVITNGVRYDSLPKVAGPAAWTKSQLAGVFDFLRANLVEPVPLINSLGHANWLLIPYPELADRTATQKDGQWTVGPDRYTIDTRNPDAWPALMKVYDELIAALQPRWLHIGLDEVRWHIHDIPAELRGADDTIDDRAERLAEWVTRLHDILAGQGIQTMMWTDMLTAGHNGGPPYHTARALARLPRDIWMVNWSSSLAPLHNSEMKTLGFRYVLEGNSEGVNRERGSGLAGNVVGLWSKVPWCSETVGSVNTYDYQLLVSAAEHAWRLSPDLSAPKVDTSRRLMAAAALPEAVRNLSREPAGGQVVPLAAGTAATVELTGWFAQPPEPVKVNDIVVPFWPRAVAAGAAVPVNQTISALYWLQAADGTDEQLKAIRDDLKQKEFYAGRPIAHLDIDYADGSRESVPIKFGWDIRSRRAAPLPWAYGAVTCALHPATEGDTAVYLRQWVNPKPKAAVKSLTLRAADTALTPLLLGAATR